MNKIIKNIISCASITLFLSISLTYGMKEKTQAEPLILSQEKEISYEEAKKAAFNCIKNFNRKEICQYQNILIQIIQTPTDYTNFTKSILHKEIVSFINAKIKKQKDLEQTEAVKNACYTLGKALKKAILDDAMKAIESGNFSGNCFNAEKCMLCKKSGGPIFWGHHLVHKECFDRIYKAAGDLEKFVDKVFKEDIESGNQCWRNEADKKILEAVEKACGEKTILEYLNGEKSLKNLFNTVGLNALETFILNKYDKEDKAYKNFFAYYHFYGY